MKQVQRSLLISLASSFTITMLGVPAMVATLPPELMSIPRDFDSFTSARTNLRGVLDAAHEGLITTVVRENERFVAVAADSLRRELSRLLPSRAAVVAEGGGWSAILPGVPVHADAETFDEAIDDLINAALSNLSTSPMTNSHATGSWAVTPR